MPIDLTDFSDIPSEAWGEPAPQKFIPTNHQTIIKKVNAPNVMPPKDGSLGIDPALIDPEMQESLDRESRQPTSIKKHLWKLNDFEGVPYDEDDAAVKRAELGMKDPDEVFKDAKPVS